MTQNSHIRSELDRSLGQVRDILLEMSDVVADRVDEVTAALLERDVERADLLIAEDDELDLLSHQAEQLCIEILLREQPVAGDLRAIVAALHMNSDIERSGDLTTNIAKAVGRLQGAKTDDEIRQLILQMADQASFLFHKAAEAYRELDGEKAADIDQLDDVLDDLHRTYISTVIDKARQNDLHPQQTLQLALIGRFYERIGDHAENMGERTRYIIDGWTSERAGAERAQRRSESADAVAKPSRGLALIDRRAEQRRIDATRRDFVANVGHELKTPVAAISLLAEALIGADSIQSHDGSSHSGNTANTVDREDLANHLDREVRRVEAIIDDLLELARLEDPGATDPIAHEMFAVDEAVAEALESVSGLARAAGVGVTTQGVPSEISIRGDKRQIVRALVNLLNNAVHYSDREAAVTVRVETLGNDVDITVTDSGVGIARPELERIFERFYRVDPARSRQSGGTGLGLSIVRHVAENHGGRVQVESVLDQGSSFSIHLPLSVEATGDADDADDAHANS